MMSSSGFPVLFDSYGNPIPGYGTSTSSMASPGPAPGFGSSSSSSDTPPPPLAVFDTSNEEDAILDNLMPRLHDESVIDKTIEELLGRYRPPEILHILSTINNSTQQVNDDGIVSHQAGNPVSTSFNGKFQNFLNSFFDLIGTSTNPANVTLRELFIQIIKNPEAYKCVRVVQLYSIISMLNVLLGEIKKFLDENHKIATDFDKPFLINPDGTPSDISYYEFQKKMLNNALVVIVKNIGKYEAALKLTLTAKKRKDYEGKLKRYKNQENKIVFGVVKNLRKLIEELEKKLDSTDPASIEGNNNKIVKDILDFSKTQEYLKQLLYGSSFKPGEKMSIRDWAEKDDPTKQCNKNITNKDDLFDENDPDGTPTCEVEDAEEYQNDPTCDLICYICGCPLYKGKNTIQCEHVLPLFTAARFFCVYVSNMKIKETFGINLNYEYKWAHRCCNQIKGEKDIIILNDDNEYIISEENVKEMFDKICVGTQDGTNLNCIDIPANIRACIINKLCNTSRYNELIGNLRGRLRNTLTFLNEYYTNTQTQIEKILSETKLEQDIYATITLVRSFGIFILTSSYKFLELMIFSSISKEYTLTALKHEVGGLTNDIIKSFDLIGFLFNKLGKPTIPVGSAMATDQPKIDYLLKLLNIVYSLFDRISKRIDISKSSCPPIPVEGKKRGELLDTDKIKKFIYGHTQIKEKTENTKTEKEKEDEKNMLSFVFWSLFNNYLFLCSYSSSKAIEMIDCSEMYEKLFNIKSKANTEYLINILLDEVLGEDNYNTYKEYLDKLNCLFYILNKSMFEMMFKENIKIKYYIQQPTKATPNRVGLTTKNVNNDDYFKIFPSTTSFSSTTNNELYSAIQGTSDEEPTVTKSLLEYDTSAKFNQKAKEALDSVQAVYNVFKGKGTEDLKIILSFVFSKKVFSAEDYLAHNTVMNTYDFKSRYPILDDTNFDDKYVPKQEKVEEDDEGIVMSSSSSSSSSSSGGRGGNNIMIGGLNQDERLDISADLYEKSLDNIINNTNFELKMSNSTTNEPVSIMQLDDIDEYKDAIIDNIEDYLIKNNEAKSSVVGEKRNRSEFEINSETTTQQPRKIVHSNRFRTLVKTVLAVNNVLKTVRLKNIEDELKKKGINADFTITPNPPPEEISENMLLIPPEVEEILSEDKQEEPLDTLDRIINLKDVNYDKFDRLIDLFNYSNPHVVDAYGSSKGLSLVTKMDKVTKLKSMGPKFSQSHESGKGLGAVSSAPSPGLSAFSSGQQHEDATSMDDSADSSVEVDLRTQQQPIQAHIQEARARIQEARIQQATYEQAADEFQLQQNFYKQAATEANGNALQAYRIYKQNKNPQELINYIRYLEGNIQQINNEIQVINNKGTQFENVIKQLQIQQGIYVSVNQYKLADDTEVYIQKFQQVVLATQRELQEAQAAYQQAQQAYQQAQQAQHAYQHAQYYPGGGSKKNRRKYNKKTKKTRKHKKRTIKINNKKVRKNKRKTKTKTKNKKLI